MKNKNILILVEGAKTDVRLMEKVINIFGINLSYNIVSYNTNIYTLYNHMFKNNTAYGCDLIETLIEHERDIEKIKILRNKYSHVILVFDLDPQDPQFTSDKIITMSEFFNESTENGKLYLNYPMVESFYHMKSIPDDEYANRMVSISAIKNYKQLVNIENRNKDYTKFAITKEEMITVISQNLQKVNTILNPILKFEYHPNLHSLLENQLYELSTHKQLFVLCTCIFFIVDYNKNLIIH